MLDIKLLLLTTGGDCNKSITINFRELKELKFRIEFLSQFLPWILDENFSSSNLQYVTQTDGKIKI